MNGDKYLVDTNILIFLLEGSRKAASRLEGKVPFVSFVTEIELLGVPGITPKQLALVEEALNKTTPVNLSEAVKRKAKALRQLKKMKVPDALIAATSMELDIPLLTADRGFNNIPGLTCILFEV
jgi:hypothetical protein